MNPALTGKAAVVAAARPKTRNLSLAQSLVLTFLREQSQPVKAADVGQELSIRRTVINTTLRTLEERGFLAHEKTSRFKLWRAIPGVMPVPCGNATDMQGRRYGKLIAIRRDGVQDPEARSGRSAMWICRCDCGREKRMRGGFLRRGIVKSCGQCLSPGRISPDTKLMSGGYDWAWAFVWFLPVPDFPDYCVGSDGSVWSRLCRGRRGEQSGWHLIKPVTSSKYGHSCVMLTREDGVRARPLVHRLILEVFVGPCPEGMQACHYPDPNPMNNNLWNLRWDTPKANANDTKMHRSQRLTGGSRWLSSPLNQSNQFF